MALVIENGNDRILRKMARRIGKATNNQAEYRAMIMAMEWALSRGFKDLVLHSDSELLVKQVLGEYSVRSSNVKDLHSRLKDLLEGVEYRIFHHNREDAHIQVCDEMVNRVLDQGLARRK